MFDSLAALLDTKHNYKPQSLNPTLLRSTSRRNLAARWSCSFGASFGTWAYHKLLLPPMAYEDNDAATAMANAQKPTTRTRHLDIKYNVLSEWVERDLVTLERVSTTQNMA